MKRHLLTLTAAALALAAAAQSLNVRQGAVTYSFQSQQTADMTYADGTTLTIQGKTFTISDITAMYVDDSSVKDNTVAVSYADGAATVLVAGNVARLLTVAVDGAHVSVIQSEEVSDATGEITYTLAGESADGQFYLDGDYKASLSLNGLTLANASGAPIEIDCGKRIEVKSESGTVNTLADAAAGKQKGCITCKGHLEFKGKGALNVTGNASHAIYAKEYVELKNTTLTVASSVKDGINCAQYFLMESGTLTLTAPGDDGIQVDFKDDTDREAEDTGTITLAGGTLNIAVTATAAKGIKAEGDIVVTGGEANIAVAGNGEWDADDLKTKAAACLSCDGNMHMTGGTLNLTATGAGGKGINCDASFTLDAGTINITTSGGLYAYVNGKEYTNYTGNTDNINSDYKSSPKGMKIDGPATFNGGTLNIRTSGNGAEGIESKSTMTINDGTFYVVSYDDCINSSSHMYINGGNITVMSSNNDGLDSNGNLYLAGGYVMAFGTSSPECGIDANEEGGYSVIFTGGTLLAVGGSNSQPTKSASTQPFVSGNAAVAPSTTVTLKSGDTLLASFDIPADYRGSSATTPGGRPGGMGGYGTMITCPGLASGASYTLTSGTTTVSVTAKTTGTSGRPM